MDEMIEKSLLRDKLEHHELPVDAADWDIIRRRLQQQKRRKTVMIWLPASAAAAVAALFLMLYHPSVDEPLPRVQSVAAASSLSIAVPGEAQRSVSPPANNAATTTQKTTAQLPEQPALEVARHETPAAADMPADTAQTIKSSVKVAANDKAEKAETPVQLTMQDSSLTALLAEEYAPPEQAKKKKWALALLANQSGNMGFSDALDMNKSYALNTPSSDLSLGEFADKDMFMEGENMFMEPVETSHHIPLSFGLTFRFYFTSHWAIESGMVYTYLSSEYKYGNNYREKQRLHYLGLPVNAVYQFVGRRRFSVYVSGGGMLEKGIRAEYTTITPSSQTARHDNIAGVQWSLNGYLGISYNFSRRFSLYAEPGIRYFFPDARQPESMRTERPFNYSLGIGLRTNF
jgi:hypothetical protein